ncbi:unnamed protein product [Paramecium octaurelia]|uniref:Uncharacterized protein n=1 Tax=Paramecium octaurelia TaxID=43137 RepID=A0A8S1VXB8_PAROT|nr:unnamed protein product [Paramecium octaurelia]
MDHQCSKNHNLPIIQIILNPKLKPEDRYLCSLCIEEQQHFGNVIGYKKALEMVDQNKQELNTKIFGMINEEILKVNKWKRDIQDQKNYTISIYDSLIKTIDEWVISIKDQQFSQENKKFLEVLDDMSDNQEGWIKYTIYQTVSSLILIDNITQKKLQTLFDELNAILNNLAMNNQFNEIFSQNLNIFWNSYKTAEQFRKNQLNNIENIFCKSHNLPITSVNIQKNVPLEQRVNCKKCKGKGESIEELKKGLDQYFLDHSRQLQNNSQKFKKVIQKYWLSLIKDLQFSFFSQLNNLTYQLLNQEQKSILEFICKVQRSESCNLSNCQNLCQMLSEKDQSIPECQIGDQQLRILVFVKDLVTKLQNSMKIIQEKHLFIQKSKDDLPKITDLQIQREIYWKQLPLNTIWNDINVKPNCALVTDLDSILIKGVNNCIEIHHSINQRLTKKILFLQPKQFVTCFADCKIVNSFLAGYNDGKLQYWKILKPQMNFYQNIDIQNQNVQNFHFETPQYQNHTDQINFIYMKKSKQNDFITDVLTASSDGLINIWEFQLTKNRISFQYSLKRHEKSVMALALNENEDILVSCGQDNKIIIWGKRQNQTTQFQTWQFLSIVKQSIYSFVKKIQFLTNNIFITVHHDQEYVHIFQQKQDIFEEQKQRKIKLFPCSKDNFEFQMTKIQNGVVCFGHGQTVYIVSLTKNQEIKLSSDPICQNKQSKLDGYCGVVNNKNIIIWTPNCKVYELIV